MKSLRMTLVLALLQVLAADSLGAGNGRITELLPPDVGPFDSFGQQILICGDRLYAQARLPGSAGAVYTFERDPDATARWPVQARLTPPDPFDGDFFGVALASEDDLLVVGAPGSGSDANGDDRVFIYESDGTDWNLLVELDIEPEDVAFGSAVALSGSTLFIGAENDGVVWPAFGPGAVHVYEGSGGSWVHSAKILLADAGPVDNFGAALSFNGNTLAVGAPGHGGYGAAFFFEREGDTWVERDRVTSIDRLVSGFGMTLELEGETAVVGSRDGAYIFDRNPDGTWRDTAILEHTEEERHFGEAVALSGGTAIVGAYRTRLDPRHENGSMSVFGRDSGDEDGWGLIRRRLGESNGDQFGRWLAIDDQTLAVSGGGLVTVFEAGPCELDLSVEPETVAPGESIRVQIHLQHNRLNTVTVPFTVVVENADGDLLHHQQTPPLTMSFQQVVDHRLELNVPPAYPPGDYKVVVWIDEMRQGRALGEAWFSVR